MSHTVAMWTTGSSSHSTSHIHALLPLMVKVEASFLADQTTYFFSSFFLWWVSQGQASLRRRLHSLQTKQLISSLHFSFDGCPKVRPLSLGNVFKVIYMCDARSQSDDWGKYLSMHVLEGVHTHTSLIVVKNFLYMLTLTLFLPLMTRITRCPEKKKEIK